MLGDIHIASVVDRNYLIPFLVMLHSLRVNTRHEKINAYAFTSGLKDDDIEYLEDLSRKLSINLIAQKLSQFPFAFFTTRARKSLRSRKTMSSVAYAKAFLDELVPGSVDKLLILDADLVFAADVAELYNLDTQKPVAAVANVPRQHHHQFNSGVMLTDMAQWRELQVAAKARRFLFHYSDCLHSHDQHVLNLIFGDNWRKLPLKWNYMHDYARFPERVYRYTPEEIAEAASDPAIIHFAVGTDKPWRRDCTHPYQHLYLRHRSRVASLLGKKPEHDPAREFRLSSRYVVKAGLRRLVRLEQRVYRRIAS